MDKITRTTYRDPAHGDAERDGSTSLRESLVDVERYTRPLGRAHGSALHVTGVGSGMEVRAVAGQPDVQVLPGVALTPAGDHVVLVSGGRAVVATGPTDVTDAGVTVPTAGITGPRLLTIAWGETFDRTAWATSGQQVFQVDHTPVLALRAPGDAAAAAETVLATVTVAAGSVTDLTDAGRAQAYGRTVLQGTTRSAAGTALSVTASESGTLRAAAGGVELAGPAPGTLSVTALGVGATPALLLNGRVAIGEGDGHLDLNMAGGFPGGVRTSVLAAGTLTVGGFTGPGLAGAAGLAVGGPLVIGTSMTDSGLLGYAPGVRSTLSIEVRRPGDSIAFVRAGVKQLVVHDGEVLVPGTLSVADLAANAAEMSSLHVSGRITAAAAGVTEMSVGGNLTVGQLLTASLLTVPGEVHLGGSGSQVFLDGNLTGPFLKLHDDVWFSDPQNGQLWVRNGADTDFATMIGHFLPPSSARFKEHIRPLGADRLRALHDDAVRTPVCSFTYRGAGAGARPFLGVVLEDSPAYLAQGEGLSLAEYAAMLHAAVQVMAGRIAELTERLDRLAVP